MVAVVACVYNPRAGGRWQEGPWGSLASESSLNAEH